MGTINQNTGNQYERIFHKFRLGLQNWCRTGKEPVAGDQDMKYYLDLQEQRLKAYGLTMKLDLQPDKEVMSIQQTSEMIPLVGSRFAQFMQSLYAQYLTRTVAFAKDSKELYLTSTLYSGGNIKQKEEKIRLRMYHRTEFPVNRSFSIAKVQCPNCGGSFDARKEKCCPYCDQLYDAGINDWIVTEISR